MKTTSFATPSLDGGRGCRTDSAVSVYGSDGFYQKNPYDSYTLNSVTAKRSADGSISIQFGGYDGSIPNCLPITPGSNYMVRLYRPHAEILNGKWKFPEAQPAS